jgi:hypothetical protein
MTTGRLVPTRCRELDKKSMATQVTRVRLYPRLLPDR